MAQEANVKGHCDHDSCSLGGGRERFYNPMRHYAALGYVNPTEFEKPQNAQAGVHETGSSPNWLVGPPPTQLSPPPRMAQLVVSFAWPATRQLTSRDPHRWSWRSPLEYADATWPRRFLRRL